MIIQHSYSIFKTKLTLRGNLNLRKSFESLKSKRFYCTFEPELGFCSLVVLCEEYRIEIFDKGSVLIRFKAPSLFDEKKIVSCLKNIEKALVVV